MFYSDICSILNIDCKVITIDINPKWHLDPNNFNIKSIIGLSTDNTVVQKIYDEIDKDKNPNNILVMLDSDHSRDNVYRELEIYSKLVGIGSYIIVEDTNVNGHPSFSNHGPGPWEAVEDFFKTDFSQNFEIDRSKERFLLTFNPKGYIRRKS